MVLSNAPKDEYDNRVVDEKIGRIEDKKRQSNTISSESSPIGAIFEQGTPKETKDAPDVLGKRVNRPV